MDINKEYLGDMDINYTFIERQVNNLKSEFLKVDASEVKGNVEFNFKNMIKYSLMMNKEDLIVSILSFLFIYVLSPVAVSYTAGGMLNIIVGVILTNFIVFLYVSSNTESLKSGVYFLTLILLTPALLIVGVIGKVFSKNIIYEEHKELSGKLKVINIFKIGINTNINKNPKTITDVEENNNIKQLNKDYDIINNKPNNIEEKYIQLESIDNVFSVIKGSLNKEVKLDNGYITRLYNVLTQEGKYIKLSNDVSYVEDDKEKVLAVDTINLEDEDLIKIIDVFTIKYQYDEEDKMYVEGLDKIKDSEEDRLNNLEYYRKHSKEQDKLKESIQDKLIIK